MGWFALSLGVALVSLIITFGVMSRKAFKKIGKLESLNETLTQQNALLEGKVKRLSRARPTVDKLHAVAQRLSKLRPEDN